MSKSFNKDSKIFLSTTALKGFWDKSQHTIFLNKWCLPYNNNFSKSSQIKYLASPYKPKEEHDIYLYIQGVYDKILPIIANKLNKLHNKKHTTHYWKIIIGPWLLYYMHVLYDRLSYLKKAINDYPELTTILLSEKSYSTPSDTLHFVELVGGDLYNLEIFSKLFKLMGMRFKSKKYDNLEIETSKKSLKIDLKQKVTSLVEYLYLKLISFIIKKPIYISDSYFSKLSIFKLVLKSFGRIVFFREFTEIKYDKKINKSSRKIFSELDFGDDLFAKYISYLLHLDIPKSFVENYKDINSIVTNKYPKNPGLIVSSNGWHFNEKFKCWAATFMEKGVKLVGLQHGGADYGALRNHFFRDYEISIVNYYFSWGWRDKKYDKKIMTMPANKLLNQMKLSSRALNKNILWGMTARPRYLVQFPLMTSHFDKYLDLQVKFLKGLKKDCLKNLVVRPHYQDHGWQIKSRLIKVLPQLKFDQLERPFINSLADCKLYVCDHISTTLLESIALNKPTILFWDKDNNMLRDEYLYLFKELLSVEILHYSAKSAAITVNNIYNNVDLWWNNKSRQKAITLFKDMFVKVSNDGVNVWNKELINLLKT